jgi:hypothetical protein
MKKKSNKETRSIIRTARAGVFFAQVKSFKNGTAHLENSRRIWYWSGAASLSELAMRGTSDPANCKFPIAMKTQIVTEVIEIIQVTPEAAKSIDAVAIWTK